MKTKTIPQPICIRTVNENIRLTETGQPLTMSLRVLNTSCKFRKKFNEFDVKLRGYRNELEKKEQRKYMKKYIQRPEVKKRIRKYQESPEAKKKRKEYFQRPEIKKKLQEYYLKNKEKILKKMREKYHKEKNEILDR